MFALRPAVIFSVLALICFSPSVARAQGLAGIDGLFEGFAEWDGRVAVWSGFDTTASAWTFYASTLIALDGPPHRDGWRLKLGGHYGVYRYDSRQVYCQLSHEQKKQLTGFDLSELCQSVKHDPPDPEERELLNEELAPFGLEVTGNQIEAVRLHQANHYAFSAMPGYRASLGRAVMKLFAGPAYEHHAITPDDFGNSSAGGHFGLQGALEVWLPLGEQGWLSGHASYFSGTSRYAAGMRAGYSVLSWLTFGPELAAFGAEDHLSGRGGGFLSMRLKGVETTLAAGMSGAYEASPAAYGSASVHLRF